MMRGFHDLLPWWVPPPIEGFPEYMRYDMTWHGMAWHDMIQYEIWYDMIWYDMIWYDIKYVFKYDKWYMIRWYMIYDLMWFHEYMCSIYSVGSIASGSWKYLAVDGNHCFWGILMLRVLCHRTSLWQECCSRRSCTRKTYGTSSTNSRSGQSRPRRGSRSEVTKS